MCTSAGSRVYDHKEQGHSSTNWKTIVWSCCGLYVICFGKRVNHIEHWLTRKCDCKTRYMLLYTQQGSNHYGINISIIMAQMATKTCRVMCKDMIYMLDEGFGHLDSGLAGNASAMQRGAAARAAEQGTQ